MRFPRNRNENSLVLIVLVCCFVVSLGLPRSSNASVPADKGNLIGSVAFIDGDKKFVAYAPEIAIELRRGTSVIVIKTDENGDINTLLPTGHYCLVRVIDKKGNLLTPIPRQHGCANENCFRIEVDQVTRWDLLLKYSS